MVRITAISLFAEADDGGADHLAVAYENYTPRKAIVRKPLIIEARINECRFRDDNARIPYTAEEVGEEAARATEAGASISHFTPATSAASQIHRPETYAAAIRDPSSLHALVYLTLGQITAAGDAKGRIPQMEKLAADPGTKPDIAPIDTESTNIDRVHNGHFDTVNRTYINRTEALKLFARSLRR